MTHSPHNVGAHEQIQSYAARRVLLHYYTGLCTQTNRYTCKPCILIKCKTFDRARARACELTFRGVFRVMISSEPPRLEVVRDVRHENDERQHSHKRIAHTWTHMERRSIKRAARARCPSRVESVGALRCACFAKRQTADATHRHSQSTHYTQLDRSTVQNICAE